MIHLLRITGATVVIVAAMLLPYLPGRYDGLALPLSMMAQVVGTAGLLVVLVGALWMASEYASRSAGRRFAFAVAATIAGALVWVFGSLAAATESVVLGLGGLVSGLFLLRRLVPRVIALRAATPAAHSVVPLYLVVVPLAAFGTRLAVADPITEFSRSRAIRNSAALIADIEQYRATNGRYPPSLLAENLDYLPMVIGIKQYHYGPAGDAYNLAFEQPSFRFGTREFVVYNPLDEQTLVGHAAHLLRLDPAELLPGRRLGHYAVHEARQAHWKYFWFD